ncbi:type IV secretory system conjugative DNA transfer family protein [Miltoncostaea marina]|uniref:type IV secretory system conjugative DNA transfer family protein n=1 Tax=Miltoncostaea marina TaxID=2843215 RepID=UPI001C3CB80A|nr:type IV secretory system conjugative DNA transfer family protein [Miltoncostaea marina]
MAVSVKRDLLDHTLAARRARGEVLIYDPTGAARLDDEGLVGWDPVASCAEWPEARRIAHNLTSAQGAAGGRDAEFWLQLAAKLIAPLLLAAAGRDGGSMRDVVGWLDSGEQTAVSRILVELGEPDAHAAFVATCRREERTLSSVYATAEAVLAPFSDPAVLRSTTLPQIDPHAVLDGASTLYVVAPAKDQERLAPLFAGLIEQSSTPPTPGCRGAPVRALAAPRARRGGQHGPDPQPASDRRDGRRAGIQVVSVFQDLAQARGR